MRFEESKHLSFGRGLFNSYRGTLTKGSYVLAERRGNSNIKTVIITHIQVINMRLISSSLAVVNLSGKMILD